MVNHRGHRGKHTKAKSIDKTSALTVICLLVFGFLCVLCGENRSSVAHLNDLALPQEKHLRNLKQLTFGGENAEAYFSSDGKKLVFQSTRDGRECDQIYTMKIEGSDVT